VANPITDFKNDHHVILGLFLIGVGAFGVIGSITGRLPAMIAGLFDPSDLVSQASGSGSGLVTEAADTVGSTATSVLSKSPLQELISLLP
jgi:hypothetical protein